MYLGILSYRRRLTCYVYESLTELKNSQAISLGKVHSVKGCLKKLEDHGAIVVSYHNKFEEFTAIVKKPKEA